MSELPNKHVFCPSCGYILDAATSLDDQVIAPKEGDIGICFQCGTLLEYEEGYFVHELSSETLKELQKEYPETYNQLINLRNEIISFVA